MSAPDKLALVTGGRRRIGAAIADRLERDGWTVARHAHSADTPGQAFVADLSDPASPQRLIDAVAGAFGAGPGLVVNCASRFTEDDRGTADAASIAGHMAVNAVAPAALALAAARARPSGAVVNILDQRVRNPVPDQLSYSLAKAALDGMTRTLAVALAPGWRVNAVAPGLTLPSPDLSEARMAGMAGLMPLGRLPTPAQIAEAAAYLAGAEGTSGVTIFVDGGAHLTAYPRDFAHL